MAASRVQELHDRLEAAHQRVLVAVENCPDSSWNSVSEGEGWTVGGLACHIAEGYGAMTAWSGLAVAGQPIPTTMDDINAVNLDVPSRYSTTDRSQALAILRDAFATASASLLALNDDDLDRKSPFAAAGGHEVGASGFVELTIRHTKSHLASILAASEQPA